LASRRNTVSTRSATISLNAASPEGIPFACMTALAISADVSGPEAVRKASCVSRDSSLWAKYRVRRYGRFGGMASGFVPGENNLIVASKFARFALWRNPFFEVVNVAADFSALETKWGDDMLLGHAPKAGSGRLEILVAAAP
jgi:hypothetical protein